MAVSHCETMISERKGKKKKVNEAGAGPVLVSIDSRRKERQEKYENESRMQRRKKRRAKTARKKGKKQGKSK